MRRGNGPVKASFKRRSKTETVFGKPSSKAVMTAWSEGAFTKSRHAAATEIERAAARSTIHNTVEAVHSQPRSLISRA
jgi:hypothetical protein